MEPARNRKRDGSPYRSPQSDLDAGSVPDAGTVPEEQQRAALWDHPAGFWFIFWGELAERASYYGMRTILALYLFERLGFTRSSASEVMAYFGAAVYFLPLLGGFVADRFFGKYWTIVGFSLPYILGHVILGVESRPYMFTALALLAMGSGVIKPNISPLMGLTYDQKRPGQTRLRSDAFAMYYGAINIGAAASSWAMPVLRTHFGYAVAFLFPAGLMAFAFVFFAAGKPFYAVEAVGPRQVSPEQRHEQAQVVLRLLGLFTVVAFFWAIFEQSPSTWTFFAKDHLDLHFFGWALEPDQLQAINPVLIVVVLPLVTVMWRVLSAAGLHLHATDKMLIGFVLTTVTMGLMTAAGYLAGPTGRVSVHWETTAYLLITVAEICISVVGLELAFTAAPASMKSLITACWLLAVFAGNLLNAQIVRLYERLGPGQYFLLLTLMMVPVTAAFVLIASRFKRTAKS